MGTEPRRVPLPEVKDLIELHQPLPFRVLDSLGRLLLGQGQTVLNERQLEALFERGACVEYDDVEAVRKTRAGAGASAENEHAKRALTLFDHWEQLTWALDGLVRDIAKGGALAAQFEALADEHIALVDRHVEAALFMCIRQDDSRFALYGLTHCQHTATVVLLCARTLGWAPERARCAVLAALTMNLSIATLQGHMAEQPDPPSKRQQELLRAHPHACAQLLRDAGVVDAEWLAAVEDHHEHPGGGGYPRSLSGVGGVGGVGEVAHILHAADVYMAKLSPRAFRAPLPPQMAARQLFQDEKGGPVAAALIKAVGVYPPGDFVRLKNGDAAIVVQRAGAGHGVVVASVLSPQGRLLPATRHDTAAPEFAITGPLTERAGLPRVLPEQLYGLLPF